MLRRYGFLDVTPPTISGGVLLESSTRVARDADMNYNATQRTAEAALGQ